MAWEKVKASLKETLTKNIFDLWIEPLKFVQWQDEKMILSSPDRYFSAYVRQKFLTIIEATAHDLGMETVRIFFREELSCTLENNSKPAKKHVPKGQMRLPNVPVNTSQFRALHPKYTFDEFMIGESNILAESACKSMVAKDDSIGPCLYINSGTGLGKSHLTHAVAHKVLADSPMTRLHYVTAKQFAAEMVRGIKSNTMDDFKA